MEKKEFDMKKKLLKIEHDNNLAKHKLHIKEIELQVQLEDKKFSNACELQRIRSAEIKRTIDRKMFGGLR